MLMEYLPNGFQTCSPPLSRGNQLRAEDALFQERIAVGVLGAQLVHVRSAHAVLPLATIEDRRVLVRGGELPARLAVLVESLYPITVRVEELLGYQ